MITTEKKTIGSYLDSYRGWDSGSAHVCVVCGRKTSITGKSFWVHLSIDGTIIERNYQGPESLGCWPIGNECAKSFNSEVIFKFED